MKIALLNLPFDNNYGGNLQRYALMHVLQELGHDVWHINLRILNRLPFYLKPYSYSKRLFQRYILGRDILIDIEGYENKLNIQRCVKAEEFYNKYIKHTDVCYSITDIIDVTKGKFDGIVVGSDQVWRKDMTRSLGLKNYFLKFTEDWDIKRVAYAVSVGKEDPEYTRKDVKRLSSLYSNFDSVSVRESSILEYFKRVGWTTPSADAVLDPTLLLEDSEYNNLIDASDTTAITQGKIYCYVLDQNAELLSYIQKIANTTGYDYVINNLSDNIQPVSIEQWLRNIRDAELVITDSYHGSVFSLLFHKKFVFCGNQRRGNNRVNSLLARYGINDSMKIDYESFEEKHNRDISDSISFLSDSLR